MKLVPKNNAICPCSRPAYRLDGGCPTCKRCDRLNRVAYELLEGARESKAKRLDRRTAP